MSKKSKGFTLIELLVVIAIIGILAAIALTAYTSAQKRARDTKRKSDLRTISNALEQYFVDNQEYPNVSKWGTSITDSGSLLKALADGGYIDRDIKDPKQGMANVCGNLTCGYRYGDSTNELYYRIDAALENTADTSMKNINDGGTDDSRYEVGNATGANKSQVTTMMP